MKRLIPLIVLLGLYYRLAYGRDSRRLRAGAPPIDARTDDMMRLPRRYIAGGIAGFFYPAPSLGFWTRLRVKRLQGKLLAYWSGMLIAADAAMDMDGTGPEESRSILEAVFDNIYETCRPALTADEARHVRFFHERVFGTGRGLQPLEAFTLAPSTQALVSYATRSARSAGATAAEISGLLRDVTPPDRAVGPTSFLVQSIELAHGQFLSMRQADNTLTKDWRWYVRLCEQKNIRILTAPHSLLAQNGPGLYGDLLSCVLTISEAVFHRQVLDDLLDFDDDLADGVAAAPIYLLLSMGEVAKAALSGDPEALCTELRRVAIRDGQGALGFIRTLPTTAHFTGRRDDLPTPAHCTPRAVCDLLARPEEADLAPNEVFERRAKQADALRVAWANGDKTRVKSLVVESGVIRYFLDQMSIDSLALSDRDRRAMNIPVAAFFYRRTLKSYQRCRDMWVPQVSSEARK